MTFPFTKDRYVHALLERDGDVCLVERTNQLTDSVHWEVVVLRYEAARVGPGRHHFAARERYPSGNDWGSYGWTYTTLPEARQKWAEVSAARRQKGGSLAKDIA
jgi:hypothetical protein